MCKNTFAPVTAALHRNLVVTKNHIFPYVVHFKYTASMAAGGREFESQWPAKSYTALQTVRHRFNIYTQVAVLPWCSDADMGTANSLHASAYDIIRRV